MGVFIKACCRFGNWREKKKKKEKKRRALKCLTGAKGLA